MGRLELPESISLDSNIFIAGYDEKNDFHQLSKKLLEEINEVAPKAFISVLVFEEFLVGIYKNKLEKGLAGYEKYLTSGGRFKVLDVDRKVARRAAQIRAKYPKIRTPDAIHIASAIEAGVKVFFTTDRDLPKRIEDVKIVDLKSR